MNKSEKILRIATTGPESTGKTQLSMALSAYYKEPLAEEFARDFLMGTLGKYTFEDLDEICRGQMRNEDQACSRASKLCFMDTDMNVLKIWSQFRFGKVSDLIAYQQQNRVYHLHLLCQTDLDWYPDPLRESSSQKERDVLFSMYAEELKSAGANFHVIKGKGPERITSAIKAIESFLR